MTTAKKIKILNSQIDKLHPSKSLLDVFYDMNWRTETLEYIRVFFGENSEPYKKCKSFNDESDDEHKTKQYAVGSALWVVKYSEFLFSCIGILQHDLYKKSKFSLTLRGFTLGGVIAIIVGLGAIAFYVGEAEGISVGKSLIPPCDTTNKQSKNEPKNKTNKEANDSRTQTPIHKDSINN